MGNPVRLLTSCRKTASQRQRWSCTLSSYCRRLSAGNVYVAGTFPVVLSTSSNASSSDGYFSRCAIFWIHANCVSESFGHYLHPVRGTAYRLQRVTIRADQPLIVICPVVLLEPLSVLGNFSECLRPSIIYRPNWQRKRECICYEPLSSTL